MPLTRAYEPQEVVPAVARVYDETRAAFDLPFVPTLFKLAAGIPEYLETVWGDLRAVARARSFAEAATSLQDQARGLIIEGGWMLPDHHKALASEGFSPADVRWLEAAAASFACALPQMSLFARLLQRGYSGGQKGSLGRGNRASHTAELVELRIPNERASGLRAWFIYADIKRTTGAGNVPSLYRVLSPFPGYLASTWTHSKRVLAQPAFHQAAAEFDRRARELASRFPVSDHRSRLGKRLTVQQWRDIEGTVDGFTRTLPQFALLAAVWERSFFPSESITRAA